MHSVVVVGVEAHLLIECLSSVGLGHRNGDEFDGIDTDWQAEDHVGDPVKDAALEVPIPEVWRPTLGAVVDSLAGHPTELLLRNGRLVRSLPGPTALPLGIGNLSDSWPVVTEESLEPEDYLLLYTDGVVEARNETGEFFGTDRLASFLTRALADRQPPAETMRRLIRAILDHQHEQLQDDATALCLHWRGPGY